MGINSVVFMKILRKLIIDQKQLSAKTDTVWKVTVFISNRYTVYVVKSYEKERFLYLQLN